MKRIIAIMLVIISLFALCACSNEIEQGVVFKKEYKPAFTTVMIIPMVVSTGKGTTTIPVPYTYYYPERWVIYIQDEVNGELVTEDFYVSQEFYNQVNIGDIYTYDENRGDLINEPYTREKGEQ